MDEYTFNKFKEYMEDNFPDACISFFHGISHWRRVEKFGLLLADDYPEADRDVIRWFAWIHDSQRTHPRAAQDNHGRIAAMYVMKIRKTFLSGLSDKQIEKLKTACRIHPTRRRCGDITVDICLDADRLDLPRVRIRTEPRRMATDAGRKYAMNTYADNLALIGEEYFGY